MQTIYQTGTNSIIQAEFGTAQHQYQLRIYSPFSQIQLVIFSKISPKLGYLTIPEVTKLANLVVQEFGLNTNCAVWLEYDILQEEKPFSHAFSLVTFDWYDGRATNPRWLPIHENWYLDWLKNAHPESVYNQQHELNMMMK